MNLEDKIRWSKELADRVNKDYNPYAVVVGYTSGKDSNVALKLATMFFKVDCAFTCNTSIAAIETLSHCENVVKDNYGLKHICQLPAYGGIKQNPDTYFEVVKRNGFPGKTTTAHSWMYKWLKDHTIQNIVSQFRLRKRNRPIVIISGARKNESKRRWGTSKDITVQDSNIWVNICNEWTDSEIAAFADENKIDRLRGIVSKTLGVSGDCFCGAFATKGELKEVKFISPSTYEKIIYIQKWLSENTDKLWTWEEGPSTKREIAKKLKLFTPDMLLCSSCMNNPHTAA